MGIELGHFAFSLAFALATVSALAGLLLWRRAALTPYLQQASIIQFLLVGAAFASLIQAFIVSDFSLKLAKEHSFSAQPLLFKITAVWGNHEGSMVLWVLILVIMGAAVAAFGRNLPRDLLSLVLAIQSLIAAAFLGFTLFTSNPFLRLDPAPFEGADLNPILQDIGLAIHPPLLYAGYVGFSVCFSFAAAALISGRLDAAWARWVRPWTLLSWTFLTLGIAMGSYWAYYELGWGGWWFWDPVENASFMPWLAGTALLHSALVMEKRSALKIWTVFLAIITFSLSLLGTFMVRSGILTSVHAFATDPTRGVVILILLSLFIGGAFALFAARVGTLRAGGLFAPISREGALILNNLLLASSAAAVLVGTLYPLILDALTGETISVGAPFFNLTFGAIMAPLLVVLPLGPFLSWKRADFLGAAQRLAWAAGLALFFAILAFALTGASVSLAPLGLLLGFWVALGALAELADRAHLFRTTIMTSLRRLIGLPKSAWSSALAHFGLGVSVIGIVAATAWQAEEITTLAPGSSVTIDGYTVDFGGVTQQQGPNYAADVASFTITAPDGGKRIANPERRAYTASGMPTTEAAIETYGFSQLYLQLGEPQTDGKSVVRIWYKPFVTLIWIGTLFMAAAGFLSLSNRRLRVGAPRPARTRVATE
jgi:cytochrome c-type biogenesis protein CcmF